MNKKGNKIAFQSNGDHHKRRRYTDSDTLFCSYDLNFDSMTSIYKSDLDILKMHLHTKNELSRSSFSKVTALHTDRQTNRCNWIHYYASQAGG